MTNKRQKKDARRYAKNGCVVEVVIDGISPMLQDHMSREEFNRILAGCSHPKCEPQDPIEIARKRLYLGLNGEYGIPADRIFACLREAGKLVRYDGRKTISTCGTTILPLFLEIEVTARDKEGNSFIPFMGEPKWRLDNRHCPTGINRPRFDNWSLRFRVVITQTSGVTERIIKDLFAIAGRRVGLGAFRPQKCGTLGRFRVVSWKAVRGLRLTVTKKAA